MAEIFNVKFIKFVSGTWLDSMEETVRFELNFDKLQPNKKAQYLYYMRDNKLISLIKCLCS